jgi:succinate dehydrogenase / fumarate reductase cytochrome b subunit
MPAQRSTVALKFLMAVTGLIMVGYLLLHMYGNINVFAGQEALDDYSHHLRTLGEPDLP